MSYIEGLRNKDHTIITFGSHPAIIQSILDFDFISGKKRPSIIGIIASGRKFERYFWGSEEILLPTFHTIEKISTEIKEKINLFLNVSSARRTLFSVNHMFENFPHLENGVIFAEDVPEKHALELYNLTRNKNKRIVGSASVGILIPNTLKLGAIGGIDYRQLISSHLFTLGNVAVFSASGGVTNEIINIVTSFGKRLSFALHFGGDRFPITTPSDALLLAEEDPATKTIIYYGELGGYDEYVIAELLSTKKITKPIICYISGSISDMFEVPPQFGHAKAIAGTKDESAQAKRKVLAAAGAHVASSFAEFVGMIKNTDGKSVEEREYNKIMDDLKNRHRALISTSISRDDEGTPTILGENLLEFVKNNSFSSIVASLFLGRKIKSSELSQFVDFVLRLLVDHGPYVSGAVNTIIASRAGRDLVSSLSAGLLTIGPRFGGAINQAASNWLEGVVSGKSPNDFVEGFARMKIYISGIGHKKYRVDLPDPRVGELLKFSDSLSQKRFTNFAKEVEKITVAKKGNLILNVDGTIAAVLLDILSEKEGMQDDGLKNLVETEFFNALFVASRTVGFIAHFLDQKRLDEGLFRLEEDQVANITP